MSGEWIDIKERRPPKVPFYCGPEQSVVAAAWHGGFLQCWSKARFVDDGEEGKRGWFAGNEPLGFDPTHWMPLPPAPLLTFGSDSGDY